MCVIAIFGPTASGKSSLALQLAKALNGVIISADSMQIYRGMDIGTAKPTKEEMASVPHKMIDICLPNKTFSVYDYKKMAEQEIRLAIQEGKLPIVVGGTGLYFDALFYNTDFGDFEIDETIYRDLKKRAEHGEGSALLEELRAIDPVCAEKLHEKDIKRILRGLIVYHSTGKTLTEFQHKSHQEASEFQFLKFHLSYSDRQNLYRRINQRVDQMISNGLLDELKLFLSPNRDTFTTSSQAIGYKEFLPYIQQKKSFEECLETLKQKTRNYAKRQITWFRRYHDAIDVCMDCDSSPYDFVLQKTIEFLRNRTL